MHGKGQVHLIEVYSDEEEELEPCTKMQCEEHEATVGDCDEPNYS